MMLAASDPDTMGAIVINGAPMSYWGGSWSEGEGENPMRYSGGLLGGSWLSSFAADLGNGVFDGANLVANFESLHPDNTYWKKIYNVYSHVDTEPPRFLEFEKWWGSPVLLNAGEMQSIADELFVTLFTVKKHVSHLLGKLGAANRTEAVARARDLGLIP